MISPFDLNQPAAYVAWREQKLTHYPQHLEELIVEIHDPRRLRAVEYAALLERCRRANMTIYVTPLGDDPDKAIIRELGRQLGLETLDHNPGADEDAISALTVQTGAYHREYIPYTNRPIAWHTDGYYNAPARQIQALLLHCVQPAAVGGENSLLDHERLYIALRDENPDFIRALSHPEAMTLPANIHHGVELRPARTGPVFSVMNNGALHMRYTDRIRSIEWRTDAITQAAVKALKAQLQSATLGQLHGRLEAGQGLISNNVLHTRTGFTDGTPPRLLYRARYYERIDGT